MPQEVEGGGYSQALSVFKGGLGGTNRAQPHPSLLLTILKIFYEKNTERKYLRV